MEPVNDIRNELTSMNSALAGMSREMPYDVPEGYFESFAEEVALMKIGRQMPFEIPQGYFEGIADSVLFELHQPVSKNLLSVPNGYFDNLPADILAKARQIEVKPASNSIGISIWRNMRWAAAALLVLGIGLGVYRSYWYQPAFNVQEELATVAPDAIDEYVQQHIDEFDVESIAGTDENFEIKPMTNQLSSEEIENYIHEAGL